MWDIKGQIFAASNKLEIKVKEIPYTKTAEMKNLIAAKFTGGENVEPIWEKINDEEAVHNPDAWQWVSEFVNDNEAIIFFNTSDEKSSFIISGGENIVNILSETFNVEFYLTNKELDYLICFNHHDVLIASGKAKRWLRRYKTGELDNYPQ